MGVIYNARAATQVIGCLLKNIDLLSDSQYTLTPHDFQTRLHKIVFSTIYNLYHEGHKEITPITIEDYLNNYVELHKHYQENRGVEFVLNATEVAELPNFGINYENVKKHTLLRDLQSSGNFDVSHFYIHTDGVQVDLVERQMAIERLNKTSRADIMKFYFNSLSTVQSAQYIKQSTKFANASEGGKALKEQLKQAPEFGFNLENDYINTIFRGARRTKFYIETATSSSGKALPDYTLIPTPIGWRRIGDIVEGDYVFGDNGKPTKVLKVFPQGKPKQIWEVELADGRVSECCEDHLWTYEYQRGRKMRTETTKEWYNRAMRLQNNFKKPGQGHGYRFRLPLTKPVEYPAKQYSIPPYVMGLCIGDGSFRYHDSNKSFSYSTQDVELVQAVADGLGVYWVKNSEYNYNHNFKYDLKDKHRLWVEEIFKDYPSLWQNKSEHKHIPKDYLLGSVEQRFDLLQGLLDTDGYIDRKSGTVGFSTVSKQLMQDVKTLAESLGFCTSLFEDRRKNKYPVTGVCYDLTIQAPKEVKPRMFRLTRKKEIAERYANNGKRQERKTHIAVVDIRPTDRYTEMTCFLVDNETHLFLTNDYIVTHNTRAMLANACKTAIPFYYDTIQNQWIVNGHTEPTLYVTTEMSLDEVQTFLWAYLSGVNEDTILNGTYKDNEERRVDTAIELLEHYSDNLFIYVLPDPNIKELEVNIRRECIQHNITCLFYDYIHTSPALLNEFMGIKVAEHVALGLLSNALKNLANELNLFVWSATQSNYTEDDEIFADARNVRGRL